MSTKGALMRDIVAINAFLSEMETEGKMLAQLSCSNWTYICICLSPITRRKSKTVTLFIYFLVGCTYIV